MSEIAIGRLLRAGTTSCVVGCRVSQASAPAFGGLVRIPLQAGYEVYGLIYDIRINGLESMYGLMPDSVKLAIMDRLAANVRGVD